MERSQSHKIALLCYYLFNIKICDAKLRSIFKVYQEIKTFSLL